MSCGKIVCEAEGEGPCLFCGAWVDTETMYDVAAVGDEQSLGLSLKYEEALHHRDKLIEFDVNSAKRLGVLDERSDWYDLSNNTWLNKEQRQYAEQMLDLEKKRAEEIDSKMSVDINLETGEVKVRKTEDEAFEFGQQSRDVNMYLSDQFAPDRRGRQFKPFEAGSEAEPMDPLTQIKALTSFNFVASKLTNEKDQNLYKQVSKPQKPAKPEPAPCQKGKSVATPNKKIDAMHSGFSTRLQSENPFDEFREAVEKAILEKHQNASEVFQTDRDFFKDAEDTGMCLSMHQPWASLLVLGFKRFEGREWTSKYKGPLWIHATS